MCYGHWMQCSFMNGPPQFGRREQKYSKKQIEDTLSGYQIPAKCDKPRRDEVDLYSFDKPRETATAEEQATYKRKAGLVEPGLIFGSSIDLEGQILNKHPTVQTQHAALLHSRGNLYVKPINGYTHVLSISLFNKEKKEDPLLAMEDETNNMKKKDPNADLYTDFTLADMGDKKPRVYVNARNAKKVSLQGGIDKMQKLTREFCCFTLGDSPTVYWVNSSLLPVGDDEFEEGTSGPTKKGHRKDRKKDSRKRDSRNRSRKRERSGDRDRRKR